MKTPWNAVPLGELCDRITVGHVGPMADEYVDQGVPFLRSQNILPFRISTDNLKFIPKAFHERLRKSALRPGDVVVVRTGYPGTAAVIPDWLADANCADLVVITPGNTLDPFFLAAAFNSTWGIASVKGRLVGSAQQHFNVGAARRLELHVPPIRTQRKIAAILSAYDELIENNNRRIKLLEEMAQRIHREWFVDFRYPGHENVPLADSELGPIPTGWTVINLGAQFAVVLGGTPSRKAARYWENGTIPWINSGRVNDLRVMEPSELITAEALASSNAKIMPRGTTLVAITGATLGQVSLLEIEACANQSVVGIYDPKDRLTEFVYLTVRESIRRIIGAASGGAQQHISQQIVRDTVIGVPPPETSDRFQVTVRPMFHAIAQLLRLQLNLNATRDLLLPRLVSGDIDVADLDIAIPEAAA